MDGNLNSVESADLIKQIQEALKRIRELEKEMVQLKKRVQVLENP